jgi:Asp-tRNA(Asn)/Glu-tRNA(Gln) amidotransferase A subunit family amidase
VKHPLDLPAPRLAAKIRDGSVSAEAVVDESLRRAKAVQARLNPFVLLREDQALAAARVIDRTRDGRPLLGVPFAAKDLTPTKGDLTTSGSWTEGDRCATETALCIRRLEQAGAILIGKTTTPEFAFSSFTRGPRWGVTRNPWNPARTPGGSSGGSGVAVATGVVPFAEGSDMGGSVRIPAACCGVVGLKPSLGRIPMTILPSVFDNISHFGPLARSVEDAVAFMAAAAGPSDEDIQSVPLPFSAARTRRGTLDGRRFALSLDLGYYAVQPDIERAVRRAAELLRDAGAEVEEIELGWSRAVNDQWFDLWCVFMAAFFGDRVPRFRDRMDPLVVGMVERAGRIGATELKRVELLRTAMWRDLARLFESHDALLCPTCAKEAPAAEQSDEDHDATLPDGRYAGFDMTLPFNMVPQCPAISLPAGFSAAGLPVGLQLVGKRFADEDLLAIARRLEALLRPLLLAEAPPMSI